jgi:hypothetical protein
MARREVITDDLDESANAVEVAFAFQGKAYKIDLGETNLNKLTKALEPFIEAATEVVPAMRILPPVKAKTERSDPTYLAAVREWAKANGTEVKDRGRIPGHITDAFEQAHR